MNHQQEAYLKSLLPIDNNWVTELEEIAINEKVPIMDRLSIQFLMQLIRIHEPRKILEIGTGIGYSTLRMLEASPWLSIVTIERDEKRYKQAVDYINKHGKQDHVEVIYGDALEVMVDLREREIEFDFVFIDAAKGKYKQFFQLAIPLLANDSLIISDNVLFKGLVANQNKEHPRYKKMVEKIRIYNKWMMDHPDFISSIIPIGDGIAVSIKSERRT